MNVQKFILLILLFSGLIFTNSRKLIAHPHENLSSENRSDVKVVELGENDLFIHNSDTIIISKTLRDLSIIFRLTQLHELFFNGKDYHSIIIRNLILDSKKIKKKQKYFKAEGFPTNYLNQYEWLFRIENDYASKKMPLEEFIENAKAALVEIQVQI